jgi:hypothetical protein
MFGISNLFRNTLPKILLGRWERTPEKLSSVKIRWANIDHCGSCSNGNMEPLPRPRLTTHALQLTKERGDALMIVDHRDATKQERRN